jgi:hypothetical protein
VGPDDGQSAIYGASISEPDVNESAEAPLFRVQCFGSFELTDATGRPASWWITRRENCLLPLRCATEPQYDEMRLRKRFSQRAYDLQVLGRLFLASVAFSTALVSIPLIRLPQHEVYLGGGLRQ